MKNIIVFFTFAILSVFLVFSVTSSVHAYKAVDKSAIQTNQPEWMIPETGMDFTGQFEQAEKQNQTYCAKVDASAFMPVFTPEGKPWGAGSKGACMKSCIKNGGDPLYCVACCIGQGPGVCGGDPGGGR